MVVILDKRYVYYGDSNGSSGWIWGRWLLFIVLAIVILLWVFLINMRRRKNGVSPMRGTAWLAPPSYGVSQNQYNMPAGQNPVPEYSATANVNDAGYFDQNGKFHRTPQGPNEAQGPEGPQGPQGPQGPNDGNYSPSHPEPAVIRDGRYPDVSDEQESITQFQRPNVPPPTNAATQSDSHVTGSSEPEFQRPTGPPPAKGSSS
ncbi:LAME_0G11122g1_1 [Lachancea meyersii CBS 8951]|uniref:LAME_0G11122g1_1 n=1 Tax=Lachancea meyersii CBS 8951 TaxID=1266667 RepID=A0A1G4K981_9SACH|nr:LAME_0G11122g1_1 [Lachancea meyersii CBS 8951]